jgi:two-component system sensor histidine kinase DesK
VSGSAVSGSAVSEPAVSGSAGVGPSDPTGPAAGRPGRRVSWGGLIWVTLWMFPLLEAASAVRGPLAGSGLAVFAVLYALVAWSGFDRPTRGRLAVAGYAVLVVLGVALAIANGRHWLILLVFVTAAGVALYGGEPRPHLPYAIIALGAVATIGIGLIRRLPGAEIGTVAFSVLLSGGLVFAVRQLLRLVRELRDTREALAVAAVAQERLRFSRDLHDLLGHTLSVIVVKAEVVRRLAERDPAAAAAQAADIEDVGRRALVEIREAVTGYREDGLAAELSRARDSLAAAGIAATVVRSATPLPPATDRLLAWVVREATTNVVRHSGARHCEIEIVSGNGVVSLAVRDDGDFTGDLPAGAGHGLRGLAERLAAASGTLTTSERDNGGLALEARVPLASRSALGGVG